jgi:hypothetical protein
MWAQIINAALGIWLMIAPALLGFEPKAADHDHIIGPVVASFAIISWWEVTRPLRWINLVIGLWLLAAPWILGYPQTPAIINSMATGLALAMLSLVRGKITQQFGGGWSVLRRTRSQ